MRAPTRLIPAGIIVVTTTAVYLPSLRAPFLFDDLPGIVNNPTIRNLGAPGTVLGAAQATGSSSVGRPLINLSFALNYAAGGLDVRGYHATNLVIHVGAALLLFGIVRRTLARRPDRAAPSAAAGASALAVALPWAVHPLQTESVTCVVQRTESLAGFFLLLVLYAFIRSRESPHPVRWLAVSVAACLLGAATKETMAVAPLLVAAYDRVFVVDSWRDVAKQRLGYYGALAASWLLLAVLVAHSAQRGGTVGTDLGVSPWHYLLTQCWAVVRYLRLTFWPDPLILDYGTAIVTDATLVVPQALLLVALLAGTAIAWRHRPALGFCGLGFFLLLAPSSSVVPLASQPIAEHRMYLPLALVLAPILVGGVRCGGRGFLALALVASVPLALVTTVRNAQFRDPVGLWEDVVKKRPGNPRARYNLGNQFAAAGRIAAAMDQYRQALALVPGYAAAHFNLGSLLLDAGRNDEAIAHFRAALERDPDADDVRVNLGNAYLQAGRDDEALAEYSAVLARNPRAVDVRTNLGRALEHAGRRAEAVAAYQEALRVDPRYAPAQFALGAAAEAEGRAAEALAHYRAAVGDDPEHLPARRALAILLVRTGQFSPAVDQMREIVRRQPHSALDQANLGNALLAAGRLPEAIAAYEAALTLDPGLSEIRENLRVARMAQAR